MFRKTKINNQPLGIIYLLLVLILVLPKQAFAGDEALEGNIIFSDSNTSDFDADLTLNYKIQTYADGEGASKKYTGFLGTFTGVSDGACNILKLLFNQRLCDNATVKIKTPTPGLDGELDFFNAGEYSINSSSPSYAAILNDTEILFDNNSCVDVKKGGCFYNTPQKSESGECLPLEACHMCAGNNITIEYICADGFTINSEETVSVDPDNEVETTAYTFPIKSIFAIQEQNNHVIDSDNFRSDAYNLPSISLTDSDAPITCENSDMARDLVEPEKKQQLQSVCASNPSSIACKREAKKIMSLTLRKMTEDKLSQEKSKFFFRHSSISANRAKRLRAPHQSLSFTNYKYNIDDGQIVSLFDFSNRSTNKSSRLIKEERRYKKNYYASCSRTCDQALEYFPTRFGGSYTTPTEHRNNCSRVFRGRNIGIRFCSTEEVVSPTVFEERMAEVNSSDTSGQTCDDVKSSSIDSTEGGKNFNILLSESFEYKTDGSLNTNFQNDSSFSSKWDVYKDAGQGEIDLINVAGNQMLRSYRRSGSHWGAGVATKMTFNPGVKIKYRHHVQSHYTNGTSSEGLFIYTGNRVDAGYYGFPGSADNLGAITTYMRGGARFYTSGIFGNGTNFELLPTSALPLVMDYTVYINTDLTWRVEIEFPEKPSMSTFVKTGTLTVSKLSNFHLEWYSGDYGDRYSYFDNIEVENTALSCNLAGVSTDGYDVSSCPTSANFLNSACSVQCEAGYFQKSTPQLSCSSEGAAFDLSGCVSIQTAQEVIDNLGVLHLDAAHGVTTSSGNAVTNWDSKENFKGNVTNLPSTNSGITLNSSNPNFNNRPTLSLNGAGQLYDPNFSEFSGATDFTRMVVFSYSNPSVSNAVLTSSGALGSIQQYSSSNLYSYVNGGSGRTQLGSYFNASEVNKSILHTHNFDSSQSNNMGKNTIYKNGKKLNGASYYSTQATTPSSNGYRVGHNSVPWQGEIAEVVVFNRSLSKEHQDLVHDHLLKKYDLINTCSSTATLGYNTLNCNTSSGRLTEKECQLSCASGYSAHSSLPTPRATCDTKGGNFEFYGCYQDGAPTDEDQVAKNFIKFNNVLHLEATHGAEFNSGKLSKWSSHLDKYGNTHVLSATNNSHGAQQEEFDGVNYLKFDSYLDKISNNSYSGISAKDEFTRVSVFKVGNTNKTILGYDPSGYSTYFYGDTLYQRANVSKSQNLYTNGANSYRNIPVVQVSRLDNTTNVKLNKLKATLNGNSLAFIGGSGTLSSTDNTTGVTIGGWTSSSFAWNGLVGEVVHFDHLISDELAGFISTYLMKKYRIIKPPCYLTGVDITGYDLSSCPTFGSFSAKDCSLSCAPDYFSLTSPSMFCQNEGQKFQLSGCRTVSTMSEYEEEAILNFDSSQGVTHSSGKVTSWQSVPNTNGISYTATSNNASYVNYKVSNADSNNQPSVYVSGSGWLSNSNFTAMNGLNEFTRIVVSKAVEAGNYRGPVAYDNASGYQAWIDRQYTRLYGRSNMGSSYFFAPLNHEKIKPYETFVSASRFDNAAATNGEKYEMRFNNQVVPTTDITYVSPPSTTSNGSYLNIGTYSNGSYNYKGDIYKILYFNRRLKDAEINFIENELMKKYGLIDPPCTLAAVDQTGYDLSSCPSSENFYSVDCSYSCATGYTPEPVAKITCSGIGSKYVLSGCKNYQTLSSALSNNVLHLEANDISGVSEKNKISYWQSKVDGNGSRITLTPASTSAPILQTIEGQKYLSFGGVAAEKLEDHQFDGLSEAEKYTKVIVYKPLSASLIASYATSSGYDPQIHGGYYYLQSNYGGGYARGSFGNDIVGDLQVAVTEFDSTKQLNSEKIKLRLNGQEKTLDYFSGVLGTPVAGSPGFYVGSWTNGYNFKGDIAEIIYFKNTLPEQTRAALETHLMKKYGLLKSCTLPSTTLGYNISGCDTSSASLASSECNISCSSGYASHELLTPRAVCKSSEGKFELSGCYNLNDYPSNSDIAKQLIKNHNVLHLDATNGVSLDANNQVSTWESRENNSGQTSSFNRIAGNVGARVSTVDANIFLEFTGNYNQKLSSTTFKALANKESFSKLLVYQPQKTTNDILMYDNASGFEGYFGGSFFYSHSSKTFNDYARLTGTSDLIGKTQVQSTILDNTKLDYYSRFKTKFNNSNIEYNYFPTGQMRSPGSEIGMSVGGYTNNSFAFDGLIGEIVLFDRALSYKENKFLTTYLTKKYKLINACSAPLSSSRYNLSNCASSKENLTEGECKVSCKAGYNQLGNHSPWVTCPSDGAEFLLSGCFTSGEINTVQKVSSCRYAPSSGIYLIDSIKENGQLLSNVKVYCEVNDTEGSINLVKTLGISGSEGFVRGLFTSNNSSSIEVSLEKNIDGVPGILVKNLGENVSSVTLTEGFHLTQSNNRFTSIDLSYHMQGSKNNNNCSTTGNASLSGPGFNGPSNTYQSSCLLGKTCTQGRPRGRGEAPINANYNNNNLGENEILTFSGSGRAGTSGDVVCDINPKIPSIKPSTFITKLNVVNAKEKLCTIPSSVNEYTLNCGAASVDGHYAASSCSLSCAAGYITDAQVPIDFVCEQGGRAFNLYGCFDSDGPTNDDLAKHIIRTKNILHYDADLGVTLDSSSKAVSWESRVNKNGESITINTAINGPLQMVENNNTYLSWQSGSNAALTESNFQPFYGSNNFTRIMAYEPRYTNNRGYYAVLETADAGYDGYYNDYNRFIIRSNAGTYGYANIYDSSLNAQMNGNFLVQVTNFDDVHGRFGAMELKFNQEPYRYASYQYSSGSRLPTNAKGVTIGKGGEKAYNGLIGDILFFNEKLSNNEVELVSNYLLKKYNNAQTCTLPSDVTGYNVNKCLTGSTELDCEVSCDPEYQTISEVALNKTCNSITGEFEFTGCYKSTDLPTPKELDPSLNACKVPISSPTGYNTTNCNTSTEIITEQECLLSCQEGYTTIGIAPPNASCPTDGGEFSFNGCHLKTAVENVTPATSCAVVNTSGLYQIATIEGQVSNTNNVTVYCKVDSNGVGYVDLVKTAQHSSGINFVKSIFTSSNSSTLKIEVAKNKNNTPGILVRNLGEYSTPNTYKEGFHLTQGNVIFNSVDTEYEMQGGSHYNVCPISNYAIPLSGPGYDGGQNSYLLACPSGKTCIQGTPTSNSDASISGTYINSNLLDTDALSWSGAGRASFNPDIVHSCSRSETIPSTKPATFITKLIVGDTVTKLCKKPAQRSDYAAFDINCSASVDGFNKAEDCNISCASGYTQFTNLELYCDQTKADFRFVGCGLNNVAQTPNNTENGKFAIKYGDYTKYFESSFSNYSLPNPSKLVNGWYVTVKAKEGPVIIYPSQDKTVTSTTPLFNSSEHQLVLKEKDGFAKISYNNGHWYVTDGQKFSYSKFKNDKPKTCPDDMLGVPGSYLLETQGFCVEANHSALNRTGSYATVISDYNDSVCSLIPYQSGVNGGTAKVLTFKHYQTIHNYALKNNITNGVLSMSSSAYNSQWPSITKKGCSWNSSYGCSHSGGVTGANNGFSFGEEGSFKHHVSYTSSSCTRNSCYNRSTINNYMEILDYESNANTNLCYDILGYSSGLGFNSKVSILSNSLGVEESLFDNDSLNSIYDINKLCKASNFDIFTGVKSSFVLPNPYNNFNYQFENNTSLAGYVAIPGGKLNFSNRDTNVPSSNQIRCMYVPGEFTCELPTVTTGYVTTGCDAYPTNKLKPSQCNISCESGFSSIPGYGPSASCLPQTGQQEGVFELRGCYSDENFSTPEAISSCSNATKEGIYLVDLVGHDGSVSQDVKVFCEVDPQGNKSINVVKTMKLAEIDGTESSVGLLFFKSNNTSSLNVTFETNDSGAQGILIRNLGENISTTTDFTTGFHLSKSYQVYNDVNIEYIMQGAREQNTCSTSNWVPLNGPGYIGGTTSYLSPTIAGFTSIQGSAKNGRDGPINAKYKNSAVQVSEILSFSGSGKNTDILYSCMESPDIPKVSGVAKPSTFITTLKTVDSTTKHCSIPTLPNGMMLNCGNANSDGYYSLEQCSLECGSGLYLYQSSLTCTSDLNDFEAEGLCVSQSELDADLDLEILEPFVDETHHLQNWSVNLTGSATEFLPVPYTAVYNDGSSSSAFGCRTTSAYPNDVPGSCELKTTGAAVDEPTLHPVNIDFIVKNLTASHGQHANFYYEIIDSDGVVSQMRWENYGDYMHYVSGTEMFSGISGFHSPSANAYRGMPMKFTTKLNKNGIVELGIESHDRNQKATATTNWKNYKPPFKVKLIFQQRDFWGANNNNTIDEINIYKSIDNDRLIGPF